MTVYRDTALGFIGIASDGRAVVRVVLNPPLSCHDQPQAEGDSIIEEAFRQLELYAAGELESFDLPLSPQGTPFMKKVWDALLRIPYGQTASYRDIAEEIGAPKACRAVGMANHRNPIPIFIPCHRVIGCRGKLTGYAGGLAMKQRLLDREQRAFLLHTCDGELFASP